MKLKIQIIAFIACASPTLATLATLAFWQPQAQLNLLTINLGQTNSHCLHFCSFLFIFVHFCSVNGTVPAWNFEYELLFVWHKVRSIQLYDSKQQKAVQLVTTWWSSLIAAAYFLKTECFGDILWKLHKTVHTTSPNHADFILSIDLWLNSIGAVNSNHLNQMWLTIWVKLFLFIRFEWTTLAMFESLESDGLREQFGELNAPTKRTISKPKTLRKWQNLVVGRRLPI